MNFYPFHIGDYVVGTRHLSLLEDLAYRRCLDLYYTHEKPLAADPKEVARLIAMREHVAEVQAVLEEFFDLTPLGWSHTRCDEEIARMHAKQDNARASVAKRTAHASVTQASSTNTKTNTKRKDKAPTAPAVTGLESVPEQVLNDFKTLRRAKRLPLTQTAVDGLVREAEKAGLSVAAAVKTSVENSWAGFRADWLKTPEAKKADLVRTTVPGPKPSSFLAEQAAHRAAVEAERILRKQRQAA